MHKQDTSTEPMAMGLNKKEKIDDGLDKKQIPNEITEDVLSSQQAVLLDELTTRLSHTQTELDMKAQTIQEQEANSIVTKHVLAGSAMGLVPLPLFDLVALTGTQHNMLDLLSDHYGVEFDSNKAKSALIALLGGSVPTLTLLGLGSASKLIPGIGTLGGNASLTLLGGATTYATGQSFIKHFSTGGTWNDFDANKLSSFFRKELAEGKHFIQRHIKSKRIAVTESS